MARIAYGFRGIATISLCLFIAGVTVHARADDAAETKRLLYVTEPGIRNDLQYGGAGVLVFDIDNNHAFVRRIETSASHAAKPENIKGVCASAATGRLYFTTLTKLYCIDLASDKELWSKTLPGG